MAAFGKGRMRPSSAGASLAAGQAHDNELTGQVRHGQGTRKGDASMSAQTLTRQAGDFGALPATLVIVMTILAMLGVVAHVAMA
jgi:hypothetical protein